ncbi:hypothetical protein [Phytohabitans flavus]
MRKRLTAVASSLLVAAGCSAASPTVPSPLPPSPAPSTAAVPSAPPPPSSSAVPVREPKLIYFGGIGPWPENSFIGEVTTSTQLARFQIAQDSVEDEVRQAVLAYQQSGLRLFVYAKLVGCYEDSVELIIQAPLMYPMFTTEGERLCVEPSFYIAAFAVPAELVPVDVDIRCEPGPITCPKWRGHARGRGD